MRLGGSLLPGNGKHTHTHVCKCGVRFAVSTVSAKLGVLLVRLVCGTWCLTSDPQDCATRMTYKSVVSSTRVLQASRNFRKSVPQETNKCPTRLCPSKQVSQKRVLQEGSTRVPARVAHKSVPKECPTCHYIRKLPATHYSEFYTAARSVSRPPPRSSSTNSILSVRSLSLQSIVPPLSDAQDSPA